jgi:hypothetical protein
MRLFELVGSQSLTRNQRLAHYLTMGFALFALIVGLNLRSSLLYETLEYFDPEAGIRVSYPVGWLIDTRQEAYIFRAQDTSRVGFKTTLQISTLPVAAGMTARNVLDDLVLTRLDLLANFGVQVQSLDSFVLPDGERASLMEYNYVYRERNPFQESIPIVVLGRDILVLRSGQAILITFLSDAEAYEDNLEIFQRFLASLDF